MATDLDSSTERDGDNRIRFAAQWFAIALFAMVATFLLANIVALLKGSLIALIPMTLQSAILMAGVLRHKILLPLVKLWSSLLLAAGGLGLVAFVSKHSVHLLGGDIDLTKFTTSYAIKSALIASIGIVIFSRCGHYIVKSSPRSEVLEG